MKYLPLIWGALWRKPLRTILTTLALIFTFTLFGLAEGIDVGLRTMRDAAREDTLMVYSRFGPPMPYAYKQQIAEIPGVKSVAAFIGMGGPVNGDLKKGPLSIQFVEEGGPGFFAFLATTPAQIDLLRANRSGIIVGKTTAERLGLKAGDQIMIAGPPRLSGGRDWPFEVLAVVDRKDGVPNSAFISIGNFAYVNEDRAQGKDMVQRWGVIVDDPDQTATIARAIDDRFTNSAAATRTEIESLTAEQSYDDNPFPEMVNFVVLATVFALLLLTSNTLMQSFRERIPEFGTLRAIGFGNGQVLGIIIAESVLQCLIGSVLGLALARALLPYAKTVIGAQFMTVNWSVAVLALLATGAVALISAALPAWRAGRMEIVNALAAR